MAAGFRILRGDGAVMAELDGIPNEGNISLTIKDIRNVGAQTYYLQVYSDGTYTVASFSSIILLAASR